MKMPGDITQDLVVDHQKTLCLHYSQIASF